MYNATMQAACKHTCVSVDESVVPYIAIHTK